jgi:hypothetical protein
MVSLNQWIISLQSSILERYDAMEDMIQASHLNRQTRLEIYQNAYLLRLAEALQSNYPGLYAVLGENDFGCMLLAYLASDPPKAASIRWFGASLSEFLESHPPYESVPVFSEIARFEWALRHTVDAADAKRLNIEELTNLDPDGWINLRIALHPSVSLIKLNWNAVAIVHAANQDLSIPDPHSDPSRWLIFRGIEGECSWRSLGPVEWAALSATSMGISFSALCEIIAECEVDSTEVAGLAATHMRQWVDEGIVISP